MINGKSLEGLTNTHKQMSLFTAEIPKTNFIKCIELSLFLAPCLVQYYQVSLILLFQIVQIVSDCSIFFASKNT